ncbi:MAG: hypothetical protein QOA19_10655, partial [Nitrososphaeraceae archaeon]|nr:hypothetical protein [Nitrososphaeraceae archaeon]
KSTPRYLLLLYVHTDVVNLLDLISSIDFKLGVVMNCFNCYTNFHPTHSKPVPKLRSLFIDNK